LRIKLDENLGAGPARVLVEAGHEVATVPGEGPSSTADADVASACVREGRCLVTPNLGFASPLVFRPSATAVVPPAAGA
jgi:predicted nuclease of predicted toxin-antitoxin system